MLHQRNNNYLRPGARRQDLELRRLIHPAQHQETCAVDGLDRCWWLSTNGLLLLALMLALVLALLLSSLAIAIARQSKN